MTNKIDVWKRRGTMIISKAQCSCENKSAHKMTSNRLHEEMVRRGKGGIRLCRFGYVHDFHEIENGNNHQHGHDDVLHGKMSTP